MQLYDVFSVSSSEPLKIFGSENGNIFHISDMKSQCLFLKISWDPPSLYELWRGRGWPFDKLRTGKQGNPEDRGQTTEDSNQRTLVKPLSSSGSPKAVSLGRQRTDDGRLRIL